MKRAFCSTSIAGTFSLLAITMASTAHAGMTVPAHNANGDFVASNGGLGIEEFSVSTLAGGESLALRARNRNEVDPDTVDGNVYTVDADTIPFQFEFQFTSGLTPQTDYWLQLDIDYDPTAATNFATFALPVFYDLGVPWNATDSFFLNGECGSAGDKCTEWGGVDSDSPWVVANSWNLGFPFLQALSPIGASYDPTAAGIYDIVLTASAYTAPDLPDGQVVPPGEVIETILNGIGDPLGSVRIQANVITEDVPAPATLALISLGLLGMGTRQRKRRS